MTTEPDTTADAPTSSGVPVLDALDPRDTTRGEPNVVVVGGWDPSAGAGLARDLLTARALGARAWSVGTAWTVQGATGRVEVEPRDPARLQSAMEDVLAVQPRAVKIGLVPDGASARALAVALARYEGPVVIDPVLAASAGNALCHASREELWPLLARALLVTPNAGELARLAEREVGDMEAALAAAQALCVAGLRWVLVKGGHLPDPGRCADVLVSATEAVPFDGPRLTGPSPRGTGCALATAVAVGLARGLALPVAVGAAKTWLAGQIAAARPHHGVWHLP